MYTVDMIWNLYSLSKEEEDIHVQSKPVLSDHIKQDIFLAFQIGGCLLLNESSTESSGLSCSNEKPKNMSCFIWWLNTGLTV